MEQATATIARVLAPNPGPLTGPGTNSWLVGTGDLCLIDPGPDDPAHLDALLAAIAGRPLGAIVVTHAHRDHSALAPRLARATGAPVLAIGDATTGRSAVMAALAAQDAFPPGWSLGIDSAFRPDQTLQDGQTLTGDSWHLRVLHTPGHMGHHLALEHCDGLFVGDTVLGWSSTVVAPPDGDMGQYLATLGRLQRLAPQRLFPGHGPVIAAPEPTIAALTAHRRARGAAVLDALAAGPHTPDDLVALIYPGLAAPLRPAAHMNVVAHLVHLMEQNLVRPGDVFNIHGPFIRT